LPKKVVIKKPEDIIKAAEAFDLKLVEKAGPNKKKWGVMPASHLQQYFSRHC